jgi:hypothetical protein
LSKDLGKLIAVKCESSAFLVERIQALAPAIIRAWSAG